MVGTIGNVKKKIHMDCLQMVSDLIDTDDMMCSKWLLLSVPILRFSMGHLWVKHCHFSLKDSISSSFWTPFQNRSIKVLWIQRSSYTHVCVCLSNEEGLLPWNQNYSAAGWLSMRHRALPALLLLKSCFGFPLLPHYQEVRAMQIQDEEKNASAFPSVCSQIISM